MHALASAREIKIKHSFHDSILFRHSFTKNVPTHTSFYVFEDEILSTGTDMCRVVLRVINNSFFSSAICPIITYLNCINIMPLGNFH